jgi:serine/threonine-protein kinase RsbW
MEIKLSLALPRDKLSVPVVRRICAHAMSSLGVEDECSRDVEVAVTEACTNVLDHVAEGDEYEVSIGIDDRVCVIEVIDTGHGFDSSLFDLDRDVEPTAEEGRGILLMRALVDRVEFTSRPESGTICHLEKDIVWTEESPIKALTENHEPTERGPWSLRRGERGAVPSG